MRNSKRKVVWMKFGELVIVLGIGFLSIPPSVASSASGVAESGPVLTLSGKGFDWSETNRLSRYSAVVIDGRLNLKPDEALPLGNALLAYVRAGGGLALVHPHYPDFRGADYFLQMVAGSSRGTPWTKKGAWRFLNERTDHPVNAAFRDEPASFSRAAEIPMLTSFYDRHRCTVLVKMDLTDVATCAAEHDWRAEMGTGEMRVDGDYAVSWVRHEQKGRIFCTQFEADDPVLARHIADGIRYAQGALVEPKPFEHVAWRSECRLDWANGIWHEKLAEKARAAQGKSFELVAFGDSITEFWGSTKDGPQKGGKEVWESAFGPFGERSQVFGMAGDRTENLLWRVTEGRQADGWTAKAIFVLVGINNRMCLRTPTSPPDTPEATAHGIREIVRALSVRHSESRIVVFGVLPTSRPNDEAWIASCNRILAGTAWDKGVVYRDIGKLFRKPDGTFDGSLFRDGLHPNSFGYARMAAVLREELQATR